MNYINGHAAEIMIKRTLTDLGFVPKTPVTYNQVMTEIESRSIPHFDSALFHIERQYNTLDVPVDIVLDYAFGIDCFFEAEDGTVVSLDVTVNGSTAAFNHKSNVQHWTRLSRTQLDLNAHLIVELVTSKTYAQLTEDDKWVIVDELEAGYASGKQYITIYL